MTQPRPFPTALPVAPSSQSSAELALTLLGPSPAMSQLWAQIRRLAPYVRSVLLTGDPDCGQEAVARLLLDLSPAPNRTFVQISADDAEARLLRASGLASLPADVFLYIPDLHRYSPAAAEGLLRLMRARRSRPFTVVAATCEDLRALAAAGRFPTELTDALTPIRLQIPCLKQRPEDLPMLLGHLLGTGSQEREAAVPQLGQDFLRAAMDYPWPGNLRELTSVIAALLDSPAEARELTASHFHKALATRQRQRVVDPASVRLVTLDVIVQEHINSVLRACRGNKLRAAEVLGISRSTLYRMLDAAAAQRPLPLAS